MSPGERCRGPASPLVVAGLLVVLQAARVAHQQRDQGVRGRLQGKGVISLVDGFPNPLKIGSQVVVPIVFRQGSESTMFNVKQVLREVTIRAGQVHHGIR